MKAKIKNLDVINEITLKQTIEDAILSGVQLALNQEVDPEEVSELYTSTQSYKDLVDSLCFQYHEKFDLNQQIAGKTLQVAEIVNDVTNKIEEYELVDYSTKPFDVTVSKEFVEV